MVAAQADGVRDRTGLSRDRTDRAAWTVAPSGDGSGSTVAVGGARAIALAVAVGLGTRLPVLPWRRPLCWLGIPWLLDRVYELVARSRHRLPGATPWCLDHPGSCEDPPA